MRWDLLVAGEEGKIKIHMVTAIAMTTIVLVVTAGEVPMEEAAEEEVTDPIHLRHPVGVEGDLTAFVDEEEDEDEADMTVGTTDMRETMEV